MLYYIYDLQIFSPFPGVFCSSSVCLKSDFFFYLNEAQFTYFYYGHLCFWHLHWEILPNSKPVRSVPISSKHWSQQLRCLGRHPPSPTWRLRVCPGSAPGLVLSDGVKVWRMPCWFRTDSQVIWRNAWGRDPISCLSQGHPVGLFLTLLDCRGTLVQSRLTKLYQCMDSHVDLCVLSLHQHHQTLIVVTLQEGLKSGNMKYSNFVLLQGCFDYFGSLES